MGLSCYAFTAIKTSLSALLWHTKRSMLPLQPHPLALCLLLRHGASLTDQPSLKQESLWAWLLLLLQRLGTVPSTCQQPCRAHLDQHSREHLTVSTGQPQATPGMGVLTSNWRVPWEEFKKLGSVVSPFQNKSQLIPAWLRWDWQDTSMLWILQALDVLPMPINVQLSQNMACTYWFNMKENLLSALGCSFHSLGHIQLCPAQLPINHIWDRVLCLHPPWICLNLFCTMTFLLFLLMVDSPPHCICY